MFEHVWEIIIHCSILYFDTHFFIHPRSHKYSHLYTHSLHEMMFDAERERRDEDYPGKASLVWFNMSSLTPSAGWRNGSP